MSDQTPVEDPADIIEAELLEDPSFERLLHFLRDSRSFDFTGYKRPSLMRQVRHRMREIGIDSYEDYQDVLQLEPREFTALFNTILINVTSFFRDPRRLGAAAHRDLAASAGGQRWWRTSGLERRLLSGSGGVLNRDAAARGNGQQLPRTGQDLRH
jgi:hypothetical protein